MKAKKTASKYLIGLAAFLWLLGFVLAFIIAPGDRYIWVPDALLLLGFWPLLLAYRCRWLWLVFGLLNVFIGFVLLVIQFMPDSEFRFDAKLLATKIHLSQYHQPFVWMGLGMVSALVGAILLLLKLAGWAVAKIKRNV